MGTRSSPPPFRRTKQGGGWSQPSRCPFFAGVCLLLLPESAGSEGAGELRVPLSGKQGWGQAVGGVGGRQVGPWPRGPQLEGATVGATAWRTRIHTTAYLLRLTHFSHARGPLVSDGDVLPKVWRRKLLRIHTHLVGGTWEAEHRHRKVKAGEYSLSPTEGHTSLRLSLAFEVREKPPGPDFTVRADREMLPSLSHLA